MAEGYLPLKKKPFERVHLEPSKRDILSVSLNQEERAMLDHFRNAWQCENDSTVLKGLAMLGGKVLQGFFSEQMLRWLASPRRVRSKPAKAEAEQNVTPNEPVV